MSKNLITYLMLPLLLLFCNSSQNSVAGSKQEGPDGQTGTLQKMIVAEGSVTMDVDLNRLNGISSATGKPETLHFAVAANSFFAVLVFNDVLRGAQQGGALALVPQNTATLPAALSASLNQLVVEKLRSDEAFDLAVRDGKTGFVYFNVDRPSIQLRCQVTIPQRQRRKTSDFNPVRRGTWTPLGSWFGGWRNFDRNEHATDRNRDARQRYSSIFCNATPQGCGWRGRTGCPALG